MMKSSWRWCATVLCAVLFVWGQSAAGQAGTSMAEPATPSQAGTAMPGPAHDRAPEGEASAPSEPSTPAALRKIEHDWDAALRRHDLLSLQLILAPEFTETSWTGQVWNRRQMLQATRHQQNPAGAISDVHDIHLQIYGSRFAVVTGQAQASTQEGAKPLRFMHVYVYRQGRWQAVSAQQTAAAAERAER